MNQLKRHGDLFVWDDQLCFIGFIGFIGLFGHALQRRLSSDRKNCENGPGNSGRFVSSPDSKV